MAENGRLPVVTFTAGGIATPADAALCMQLGADGVFVGSGIFKSGDPALRAKAIVEATTHFRDAEILARVSAGLGEPMVGISTASLEPERAARDPRLVAAPHLTGGSAGPSGPAVTLRRMELRRRLRPAWSSTSFLLYAGAFTVAAALGTPAGAPSASCTGRRRSSAGRRSSSPLLLAPP